MSPLVAGGALSPIVTAIVREGYGTVSYLEVWWLLVSAACLKDAVCALLEARRQLRVVGVAPVDEVDQLLAVIDWRAAWQLVVVQSCFLLMGVIGAVREPPVIADEGAALASLGSIALLVGVQVAFLLGARNRRALLRRIDDALRRRQDKTMTR